MERAPTHQFQMRVHKSNTSPFGSSTKTNGSSSSNGSVACGSSFGPGAGNANRSSTVQTGGLAALRQSSSSASSNSGAGFGSFSPDATKKSNGDFVLYYQTATTDEDMSNGSDEDGDDDDDGEDLFDQSPPRLPSDASDSDENEGWDEQEEEVFGNNGNPNRSSNN
eukprot:CAMPEP_0196825360 /NCGR_PEP_ID=MMETSP1362-20130617/93008_1 /TAXON_ID=163516 /ORGANISM="Leptocylindrus danicus, Strain CCMP1856" /LENGTH=165 /DNA_ID=CAMNT_0042205773 /DNA_START=785 /DNA_END=1284 /DNA_ORIENTATION=-